MPLIPERGFNQMVKKVPIHVTLDTTANPEVIVIPFAPIVRRHEEIIWTRTANEYFTFLPLTPEKGTLHDIELNADASEMTATYDAKAKDECDYTVTVLDANGFRHDTIHKGRPIGTGGGPTIKNN
jgi:hypothetical protein